MAERKGNGRNVVTVPHKGSRPSEYEIDALWRDSDQ